MENRDLKELGKILLVWEFPEYERQNRSKAWYLAASIVVALLLLYALVTVNFLFAVIIIMGAIILILKEKFVPQSVKFAVSEKGISVDGRFYPYALLHSFYLIYRPGEVKKLFLEFKSFLRPRLNIPLMSQNPLAVRDLLNDYLTEDTEKEDEPASEVFNQWLKL